VPERRHWMIRHCDLPQTRPLNPQKSGNCENSLMIRSGKKIGSLLFTTEDTSYQTSASSSRS
jgi:hypothetical protein